MSFEMGYGDDIMATGLAKGLAQRGKHAAFGDGRKIMWGPWSEQMFRHNPNIARPGQEHIGGAVWIAHYKGSRLYNRHDGKRWVWNYDFKVTPGEFYFSAAEEALAGNFPSGFVVVEPNCPWQKPVSVNKDWGEENYIVVADELRRKGKNVIQFIHKNSRRKLKSATHLSFENFRDVIALLSRASLYVGPEGGMHHASAAVGTKAVVIMGGFIPPSVVGYEGHINLTGTDIACGNIEACAHCRAAMRKIKPEQVLEACLAA